MSEEAQNSAERIQAAHFAFSLLNNLKAYSKVAELCEEIGTDDERVEGSLNSMKKAFLGLGRDEDLIAFLAEVSRVHPKLTVQRDSLFELARIFLDKQRVEEAKRVLDRIASTRFDPKVIQKLEGFRFEAELLQPGMPFPKLSEVFAGKREQIEPAEKGRHVVLFWRASCLPSQDLYWWLASDLRESAVIAVHLGKPRSQQGRPAGWSPSHWVSLIDELDFSGVAQRYNVHATPTAFVIDDDGIIIGKSYGVRSMRSIIADTS